MLLAHLLSLPAALMTPAGLPAAAASAGASAHPSIVAAVTLTAARPSDWSSLQRRFTRLADVLRGAGGVLESDLGIIRDLLEDVRAFNAQSPDHRGATALELQLSRWIGEDAATIGALYERLAQLTGDDPELALSAFRYRVQNDLLAGEARTEAVRELLRRFPGNREILREAVRGFQDALMYDAIVTVLDEAELDPTTNVNLLINHAQALFAEHEFERALAVVRSIDPTSSGVTPAQERQLESLAEDAEQYIAFWEEEQAIRRAEIEADDLPRIVIETSRGSITLELFENEAPNTVANFISLSESGFYADTRFHRFVSDMMIQGGDPDSRQGPGIARGMSGPGYTIADEHGRPEERRHFRDSIAMAKTTEPNTGGSQFYLTHRPLPWLNGRHTVFGRVIEGLDIVRSLRQDDEIHAVIVLRKRDHDYEPEVIRTPG